MLDGLTFEAETHTYRFRGQVVPSVTQALEPLQMLDGVSREALDYARDRGSKVHLACHLYNMDTLDEAALDPALTPYLRGWQDFLTDTGFEITSSEVPIYNRGLGYAGTPDVTGNYAGTTWVIDIKSGEVPSTVGAQLAAYQHALAKRPRRRLCVQLLPDGRYKMFEQKDMGDMSLFISALNIHNFRARRNAAA
jgi:hypothetical protein